jgi:hypothetical protein
VYMFASHHQIVATANPEENGMFVIKTKEKH